MDVTHSESCERLTIRVLSLSLCKLEHTFNLVDCVFTICLDLNYKPFFCTRQRKNSCSLIIFISAKHIIWNSLLKGLATSSEYNTCQFITAVNKSIELDHEGFFHFSGFFLNNTPNFRIKNRLIFCFQYLNFHFLVNDKLSPNY